MDYYTEHTATNKPLHKLGEYREWRYKLSIIWRLNKICLLGLAIIKNCPLTMIEAIIAQQPLLRLRTALLYAIFRGDQVIIDRIILAIQNKQKSNDETSEKINLADLIITAIKTLARPDKTVLSLLHRVTDSDIHNCPALSYALLYGLSDTVLNALYQKGMHLHRFTNEAMYPAIARDETLALALFNDCQEHGTALDNTNLARYCLEQNKFNFLLQLIDANSHAKHEETPSADNSGYKGVFFQWNQGKSEAKPISLQFASISCAIELSCKEYLKNRHAWDGLALTEDMHKTIANKWAHVPSSEITTICLANGLSLIALTNTALKAENLKLLHYCLQNSINQRSLFSTISFDFYLGQADEMYGVYDQDICLLHMLAKHPNQTFAQSAIQMLYKEFHWSLDWDANTAFFSPLHMAAWEGKGEIVAYLLALGDDINKQNKLGLAPLHAAAFQGHEHVVNILIAAGANVKQLTKEGRSSLYCAFLSRKMTSTLIERLVEADGFIEDENYLQAHMVARYNADYLVRKIPKNANLLSTRAINLCIAVVNKAFDTIDYTKALLHGLPNTFLDESNNSKQPKYPLHAAIHREDIALLKQLIEAGADINQPDENNKRPIDIVIQSYRGLWIIPILLENGLALDEELIKTLEYLSCYDKEDYKKHIPPEDKEETYYRSKYFKALFLEKDNPQEALTQYKKLAEVSSIQTLVLKRHAHLLSTMDDYATALEVYQQAINLGHLNEIADAAIDFIWRLSNGTITNHNLVVISEETDNHRSKPANPSQEQYVICDLLEQLLDAKYKHCSSHFKLADSLLHFDLPKYLLHRYTLYHLNQVRPNQRFYREAQLRIKMFEQSCCPITSAIDHLLHEQNNDDVCNEQISVLLTQIPAHLDAQTLKRNVLRFLLTEICKKSISSRYISAICAVIFSSNPDIHTMNNDCQFALQYPPVSYNEMIEKTLHIHLLDKALSHLFFRVDLLRDKHLESANELLQQAQDCELFKSKRANPNNFLTKNKNALVKIRNKMKILAQEKSPRSNQMN